MNKLISNIIIFSVLFLVIYMSFSFTFKGSKSRILRREDNEKQETLDSNKMKNLDIFIRIVGVIMLIVLFGGSGVIWFFHLY